MKSRTRTRSWPRLLMTALLLHFASGVALADETGGQEPAAAKSDSDSQEQNESGGIDVSHIGASTLDLVIIRPLGVGATVVGFVMFVVSVPFVAPSRGIGTSWEIFVEGPGEYTFVRPIGEI
ncbi:MAG: hypothetical protein JRG96_13565 [Deltaproteobacteria bacterium]|nr:hypothetical protein [Deltaproteobacteria bacterium]MBW2418283.1 hypothetical protein [Deltaproteobacteria bacterium]